MTDHTALDWQAIAATLATPFPPEVLRTHPEKKLTYVPISEVVNRLNRTLGIECWSYQIVRVWEAGEQQSDTGTYPVWIMAHVRLTLNDAWQGGTFDGVGGQQVKMLRSGRGPVDLGDEYKGAVSDALKKAAQHLGVGLDLARKDEALEWERRSETADLVDDFRRRARQLPDTQQAALKAWLAGQPQPTRMTADQLAAALARVAELEDVTGSGTTIPTSPVGGQEQPASGHKSMTAKQRNMMFALLAERKLLTNRHAVVGRALGLDGPIESMEGLSAAEAGTIIDYLQGGGA